MAVLMAQSPKKAIQHKFAATILTAGFWIRLGCFIYLLFIKVSIPTGKHLFLGEVINTVSSETVGSDEKRISDMGLASMLY